MVKERRGEMEGMKGEGLKETGEKGIWVRREEKREDSTKGNRGEERRGGTRGEPTLVFIAYS